MSIALVGKYTKLEDAYASVIKALKHAALAVNHRLESQIYLHIIRKERSSAILVSLPPPV